MYPNEYEQEYIKVVEVDHPERMLDSRTKTAMMTIATWADLYRVGEDWHNLQSWRQWQHGKPVNEISHFGEYTTMRGDILTVCPLESDDVVCYVQVTEIRMVDTRTLSDAEYRELGYQSREDYLSTWHDYVDDTGRGWFMRVMLLPDMVQTLH